MRRKGILYAREVPIRKYRMDSQMRLPQGVPLIWGETNSGKVRALHGALSASVTDWLRALTSPSLVRALDRPHRTGDDLRLHTLWQKRCGRRGTEDGGQRSKRWRVGEMDGRRVGWPQSRMAGEPLEESLEDFGIGLWKEFTNVGNKEGPGGGGPQLRCEWICGGQRRISGQR